MKAERIKVSPFAFSRITDCRIEKEAGTHGYAMIKGYIDRDKEEEYLELTCGMPEVAIQVMDEDGESIPLYCGILQDAKITHKNGVCTMEITIVPYTYLLDLNPRRRSFQNPAMTYQDVLDNVLSSYAGEGVNSVIMNVGADTAIGEPIVQYQETDWEFAKRLASHFNTVVTPSYTTSGPKFYVGLMEWPGAARISPSCYRVKKAVSEYLYKEQNQVEGIVEDDSLWYIVEDQELYEIGEMVEFRGRTYYVARMEGRLDGHQLWNTYYLKTLAGFKIPRRYNEKVIGASLDGNVTAVSGDKVQVRLAADAAEGLGKWFEFSTVYSSPDGTGWYCMPEIGDEIRLYFPTEREKHGYVISSVHLPVAQAHAGGSAGGGARSSSVRRCDPTHKTIHTVTGKKVELTETYILLDAGNGMSIRLDDGAGITIRSPLQVNIKSDDSIAIKSSGGKVEVAGGSGVTISQADSKVEVASGNVIVAGANAKVQ